MFQILSLNFFKFLTSEFISRAFPFLVTLYIASVLGANLFGQFILYWTIAEIIQILVSFNIQSTTRVYFFKKSIKDLSKIAGFQLFISMIIVIAIISSAIFISYIKLIGFDLLPIIFISFSAFFRTISNYALSIFQCKKMPNFYLFTSLSYVLTNSCILVLFINEGNFLYIWSISILISSFIQLLTVSTRVFEYLTFKNVLSINVKEVLSFSFFYYPQAIAWMLKPTFERIAIITIFGASYLGQFGLATQISSTLLLLAGVINLVVLPDLNKTLLDKNFIETKRIFRKAYLLLVPAIIFVLFGGIFLINNFYDKQYSYAAEILPLLILSILPHLMVILKTPVLYFYEDSKYVAMSVMLTFIIYGICIFIAQKFLTIEVILIFAFIANLVLLFAIERKVVKKLNK